MSRGGNFFWLLDKSTWQKSPKTTLYQWMFLYKLKNAKKNKENAIILLILSWINNSPQIKILS